MLGLYLVRRLAMGKSRVGWSQRWGHLPPNLDFKTAPRLWVHAASVGEVMAAMPVLQRLREQLPGYEIVFSTVTQGGYEMAQSQAGGLDTVVYAPFDVPWAVRRAIRRIQPDLFLVLETELWPNVLHHVKRWGARIVLVNGRISDRSLSSYRRLKPLFAWVLSHFDRLLAQSERDAERLRQIGAEPGRVTTMGNAKFDQAADCLNPEQALALRRSLRIADDAPVWVVGSTRLPEEERQVVMAYLKARESLPNLVLIHTPRHVERADEVAQMMRSAGLNPVRRTELASATEPVKLLILDTIGELANVYAVGEVAFIGNSLAPPGGGQNLLQPLAQGKPVLYGPYMNNFRDIVALAESAGVGFPIHDSKSLANRIVSLIGDPPARAEIAARALNILTANRGVAARCADAIVELMAEGA